MSSGEPEIGMHRTQRVLFISLGNRGGMAHYAHGFCNGLVAAGWNVTMLTIAPFEVSRKYVNYRVIQFGRIRTRIGTALTYLRAAYEAQRLERAVCPSLVMMNGYIPIFSSLYTMFRGSRAPIVCVQHEIEPRVGRIEINGAQRRFYHRVSAIVVHENSGAEETLRCKYQVGTPVVTIPHGLYEEGLFPPAATDRQKRHILSFGMVREDKALDLLVEAYPGPEQCCGLELRIAGEAKKEYRETFRKIVADRNGVTWDDSYINMEDAAELYSQAQCAVLPFKKCTQSGSLRLAIYFGCPVIVTDVGEMGTFVRKHNIGLVVPVCDRDALGKAIVKMAKNGSDVDVYRKSIAALISNSGFSWAKIGGSLERQLASKGIL